MSVLRQFNALGQIRVDVPHIRSIESSIAADFDVVVGRGLAGVKPLILRGFTLSNIGVGVAASAIQMSTADGIAYNLNSSESGSFLWIPSDRPLEVLATTNSRVIGSFTANSVNFVGIDFLRSSDASTADLAQFINADTLTESGKTIPLGRTLDYKIYISTSPFSSTPNIVPIAKVTTDIDNKIAIVQDARPMMFRLGSGGDFPNYQSSYSYPFGRQETLTLDKFTGGDKNILSNKDWMDAVMTRIWEIGGGENWYSPTADRNVRLVREPTDVFTAGDNFEVVSNNLHWRGLSIVFDNANTTGVYYNAISDQLTDSAGLTNLAVGECIYVDIDRSQNATLVPQKALLQSLGSPVVPGTRFVIAWRTSNTGSFDIYTRDYPYYVGITYQVATPTSTGSVKLSRAASTPSAPIVISDGGGEVTGTSSNVGLVVRGNSIATSLPAVNGTALYAMTDATGMAAIWGVNLEAAGIPNSYGVIGEGKYGGIAGVGLIGSAGGVGVNATGGNSTATTGGSGVRAVGGNTVNTGPVLGGYGVHATGGTNVTSGERGGYGVYGIGGVNNSGIGGYGVGGIGGSGSSPGIGMIGLGGDAASGNTIGGIGAVFQAGASFGTAVGGQGLTVTGGAGSGNAIGGRGATITGGLGGGTSAGGIGLQVVGGGGSGGLSAGGTGLVIIAGTGTGANFNGAVGATVTATNGGGLGVGANGLTVIAGHSGTSTSSTGAGGIGVRATAGNSFGPYRGGSGGSFTGGDANLATYQGGSGVTGQGGKGAINGPGVTGNAYAGASFDNLTNALDGVGVLGNGYLMGSGVVGFQGGSGGFGSYSYAITSGAGVLGVTGDGQGGHGVVGINAILGDANAVNLSGALSVEHSAVTGFGKGIVAQMAVFQGGSAPIGLRVKIGGSGFFPSSAQIGIQSEIDGTNSGSTAGYFVNTGASGTSATFTNTSGGTVLRGTINIVPRAAPSTPLDGDIWVTTSGIFCRVNGTTRQFNTTP